MDRPVTEERQSKVLVLYTGGTIGMKQSEEGKLLCFRC